MQPAGQSLPSAGPKTEDRPAIPDYELVRPIGRGAYGEVWLARSTATGVLRAVKVVYRASFTDDRPFLREFGGIRKFEEVSRSHPSQLALFHVGRDEAAGRFYYVMELADPVAPAPGSDQATLAAEAPYEPHTLRSDLANGRLPAARVLELALALAEALAHLHGHGLVHRDVKPSNIIFVNARPKLADIGLVTDTSDARSIVGTEGYLPPEGPGLPQADIFALGRVLYEALTGLASRQFPDLPADIRGWSDWSLAFELNEILLRAAAGNVGERYRNAEEMFGDFERVRDGRSVRRRRIWRRRMALGGRATLIVAILALGGLMAWLSVRTRGPSTQLDRAVRSGTSSVEAFHYLEAGQALSENATPNGFASAISAYENAISIDPNYARAWAGLAGRLLLVDTYGGHLPSTNALRGRDAALKAIELDGKIAAGHTVLGLYKTDFEWDWPGAEDELRLAIRLDPDDASGHFRLGYCLVTRGAPGVELALGEMREALAREPLSAAYNGGLAVMLYFSGRYREAVEQCEKALGMGGDGGPTGWEGLAEMRFDAGLHPEAVQAWLKAMSLRGVSPAKTNTLQIAYDRDGIQAFLRERLEHLTAQTANNARAVGDAAITCCRLGDRDGALRWLDLAVERRHQWIKFLRVHPAYNPIRSDPRFQELLKRVGLKN